MNPLEHIHVAQFCDLCGCDIARHGVRVAAGSKDLLGVRVSLSTLVCRQCRFLFQPERFSDALIASLYARDTSFDFGGAEADLPTIRSCLAERQTVISAALATHGLLSGASVLDIGGGRGECCRHLVQSHQVVLADATECPPVDPRIRKVPGLFSTQLKENSFDVVVMNHVLEHVFSPTEFLASARHVLKNEGVLIVEVPFELYTPLVARHLGDWRHVAYFCRTTLRQFLEKSGFVVERLVLERGCYGARRLPVIRAVASKLTSVVPHRLGRNSPLILVVDMLAPVAMWSIAKRLLAQ